MPSDRPMPISPLPHEDFTPAMLAYEQGNAIAYGPGDVNPAHVDEFSRTWAGIIGKAGRLADLFLPYYAALKEPETNVLGARLTELVRLAVATTTGCEACLSGVDPRSGLAANVIGALREPDRAEFTPRERAAVRYTLAFCTNHNEIDDAVWAELKSLFSDQEIVTLCLFVSSYLGMGRLAHAMRLIDAHCTLPDNRLTVAR